MDIQYTSGWHGNVAWAVEWDEVAFSDLSVAVHGEKGQHNEQQC